MSESRIASFDGPVAVKSGDRTIAFLTPVRPADPAHLHAFERAVAEYWRDNPLDESERATLDAWGLADLPLPKSG